MEPVNNQDVLIRLLKDGHISSDEFKSLYSSCENEGVKVFEKFRDQHLSEDPPVFVPLIYPTDFNHLYDPKNGPFYTTN